jgi:hypothetical protein
MWDPMKIRRKRKVATSGFSKKRAIVRLDTTTLYIREVKSGAFSQKFHFFSKNFSVFFAKVSKTRKSPEMAIFDKIPISSFFPKSTKSGIFVKTGISLKKSIFGQKPKT